MAFPPAEPLAQQGHSPVQVHAHGAGRQSRARRDLGARHPLYETQNQCLPIRLRELPDEPQDRARFRGRRILGQKVFGKILGPRGAAEVIGRPIPGDPREPAWECSRVQGCS